MFDDPDLIDKFSFLVEPFQAELDYGGFKSWLVFVRLEPSRDGATKGVGRCGFVWCWT